MAKRSTDCAWRVLFRYRTWLIALFQASLVFCSLVLAWFLRFDFHLPYSSLLFSAAPILILIRVSAMAGFGLHHGWWRYASVSDVLDIAKAVTLGSAAFFLSMHFVLGATGFPGSVYVIEALTTAGGLAGARLLFRAIHESSRADLDRCKQVIVIGAGFAGQMVLREIMRQGSGYVAVGCADDDASKLGLKIQGVPVLGTVDQLETILQKQPADEMFIAVPSATARQMQRFVSICEKTGVRFKTLPTLRDLIVGQVIISQLREVNLEDLLGRDPVEVDLKSVREEIAGRAVMVTGAAGSIGSELCRQILEYCPSALLCLDHNETGIFFLQQELARRKTPARVSFRVADVGDRARMQVLLHEHRPEIIFHAAAYKHVPVMEENVQEAVKNNVFSLLSLLEVAEEHGSQSFVLISSDKAVRPTSVMGATKRVGELILSCRPANRMRCVAVRFGNVLGSSGSVVCVLQEQLRKNQPLTVTHPEIRRFFMTSREAVSLVLEASAIGAHGDILVLDMGEPVRVLDLARSLARLSGKSEAQIDIQFTGLRPGEKLYEELFYPTEEVLPTASQKVKRAHGVPMEWPPLVRRLEELRTTLDVNGAAPVRAELKQIVPEYSYRVSERAAGTEDTPATAEPRPARAAAKA